MVKTKGSENKMKHSPEKILKALHVIMDECCELDSDCDTRCPFKGDKGDCLITYNSPNNWTINDEGVIVWKGLL